MCFELVFARIDFQAFIREGCLMKLSRKGYQQRMFFLFSDMLVYTTRMATPALQFKVFIRLSYCTTCHCIETQF